MKTLRSFALKAATFTVLAFLFGYATAASAGSWTPLGRPGDYQLTVVGAGIASQPVNIRIRGDELVGNYGLAPAQAATAEAPAQVSAASSAPASAATKMMRMLKPIHRQN